MYTELWARLGVIFQILKRLFALHKVYPMQFLIWCEVRKQVYTFRYFVCSFVWFSWSGEGFFYIYEHTHTHTQHMLEGLNLVSWSKFKRSKLSIRYCIYENRFSEMTHVALEWRIFPFSNVWFLGHARRYQPVECLLTGWRHGFTQGGPGSYWKMPQEIFKVTPSPHSFLMSTNWPFQTVPFPN